jgi:hypothetical protein
MRSAALCFTVLLACCGTEPKPAQPVATEALAPPKDESRRLPKANFVDSKVAAAQLLGKKFMPGGTVGHYKKGKTGYDIFVARLATPMEAAVLLPDWRDALTGAKVEAAFGGYFGEDSGRPVFVFCKGSWIAGVAGLPEKDADQVARNLAPYLD